MNKTQIKAEIVADSINQQGDRLTSLLITFPRIILAEINTHRMLSKNTSSSRAIPFNKMVESVENDPFIPIAWQKDHKGMQGKEYINDKNELLHINHDWLLVRDYAVMKATTLNKTGEVTKQLCNRLLEPFMWTTMLITGSKEGWDNFFELRCPQYYDGKQTHKSKIEYCKANNSDTIKYGKEYWQAVNEGQAEIHIMDLAEKIYDAMNESEPKQLKAGEWHIPFEDKINYYNDGKPLNIEKITSAYKTIFRKDVPIEVKISTAMAARTSYTVVGDEKEVDYEKMIKLHDRLIEMRHDSPLEHCARAMSDEEYIEFVKGFRTTNTNQSWRDNPSNGWCRNFKGFIQYRHIIENN